VPQEHYNIVILTYLFTYQKQEQLHSHLTSFQQITRSDLLAALYLGRVCKYTSRTRLYN